MLNDVFDPKNAGSKTFWVQRNSELKEISVQKIWLKTELSFKKFAQRFLIKTNFGKILGPKNESK